MTMKITKGQLQQIIREELASSGRMLDYGHTQSDSHEGEMAKSNLVSLARRAAELESMLSDADDLPQWVHYKIATAKDRIQSVYDYLVNKIERDDTSSCD